MVSPATPEQTITSSWRPSPLAGAERVLVLWSPKEEEIGRAVVLDETPLTVGRVEAVGSASMVLTDPSASRHHARIELDPPRARRIIHDIQSRNGTFVDGERTSIAELSDGSVIRIGDHVLLYQCLTAEECLRAFDPPPADSPIVGVSPKTLRIHHEVQTVAVETFPVLILGESGVGKELVAEAIHRRSTRRGQFVPVNCAALPENLIESELFGHARGAFTDAVSRRGLFKEAEGGTLFLDEIGDLRLDLQAKLLRALATGEIRRVGDDRPEHVDVRVLAATNVDLERAVAEGKFRGDLHSRLMEYVIEIPPLRERKDDILELAAHFLERAEHSGKLTADAAEALCIHHWPYNVREVEQIVRTILLHAGRDEAVSLEHLPTRMREPFKPRFAGKSTASVQQKSKAHLLSISRDAVPNVSELREVLDAFDGNITKVANFFRRSRRQIYRWAESLGIDMSAYRKSGDDTDGEATG